MDRTVLETALRVLNAWVARQVPAPEDLERLRASATGAERDLAADVLAAQIIQREIERGRSRRAASK